VEVNDEFAWLEEEPSKAIIPATPIDTRLQKLIEDSRALPIRRRIYLRALCENQLSPTRACRALNARGIKLMKEVAQKWHKDPLFGSLLERYGDLTLEAAGTSRTAVLLNFAALVDYGMEPVIVDDKEGVPIDKTMRDADLALAANDKLAKAARIYGEDAEKPRMVIELDFTGHRAPGEVFDGDFVEVKK
jgi:hypothetical protein